VRLLVVLKYWKEVTSMRYVSAIPAYGRDYKSKKAVLEDWNAGKDFLVQDMFSSGYVNKDDKPADLTINIRYNKLQNIVVIK
jgi:hypothetical protein